MILSFSFPLFLLILLAFEKFIQHMFVTYAFAVDLDGIRAMVVLDYRILILDGFFVGLPLVALLWGATGFSPLRGSPGIC